MKFGVIVFPGSNCDHDAYHVLSKHVGQPVDFIWHKETDLSPYDAILIPGGFSYGDYLRAGALARFSPVMNAVKDFAAEGNYVCDEKTFQRLEENNQIVFRYCDDNGEITKAANPNGAGSNIAGICNLDRNVLGMMPHPERACEGLLGSSDGLGIFRSLNRAVEAAVAV